jgi:cell division protein FtsZ
VTFGTVIEEDMEDKLRVTVIATGFDRDEEAGDGEPAGGDKAAGDDGSRRTVPLDDEDSTHRYKGEDNLRQLDTPAYERRSSPVRSNQDPQPETDEAEDGDEDAEPSSSGESRSNDVRRLQSDDREDRDDRSRSDDGSGDDDSDTPAFLRKMMD